MSNSLWPHESQHTRPPCPSPSPRVHSHSCPSSRWCHPAISSSVFPFSSCPQSLPASESFPMSQLFASGGQSIRVSASTSVLPMNIQDWFPLGWTGWITLQSKGLSRVFSNTTVQKHQFFGTSLLLNILSRLVITFLPRSKRLYFMAAITICSDFGAPQNKVCHCFPIYLPWNDGTRCHDLRFLNVEL